MALSRTCTYALHIIAILLLCHAGTLAQEPLLRRQTLLTRLDSLELSKQELKRQGQPLDELEKQTLLIKDTLDATREALPLTLPDQAAQAKAATAGSIASWVRNAVDRVTPKSKDLFDWILLAAAVVAAIVVLVLAQNVLKTFLNLRRKPRRKGKLPPVESRPQARTQSYGPTGRATDPLAKIAPVSESIEQLRQRIGATEESAQLSVEAPAPPRLDRIGRSSHSGTQDLKSRVILAARDGLSVSEIARKLQIGTDQVTLILKVARKRQNPNDPIE